MKICMLKLLDRINLKEKAISSSELVYLSKWLEEQGHEVFYFGRKTAAEKDIDNYIDMNDIDNFDEFDELWVYSSAKNFFGGEVKHHVVKQVKMLLKYKGTINVAITDPAFALWNIPEVLYNRDQANTTGLYHDDLRVSFDEIERFQNLNWKIWWVGKDFKKLKHNTRPEVVKVDEDNWNYLPLPEYMFRHKKYDEITSEIEYELMYYGFNRSGRKKVLDKFFNNNLKKYLVEFKAEYPNTTRVKKVPHSKILNEIHKAKSSIVIGDETHNNNLKSLRIYEIIKSGVICFIDNRFDSDKTIFKHPHLQKFNYVNNGNDIERRLNRLNDKMFNYIIELQKKEYDL